jgi:hypothetical protein
MIMLDNPAGTIPVEMSGRARGTCYLSAVLLPPLIDFFCIIRSGPGVQPGTFAAKVSFAFTYSGIDGI